jgi:hypothetical protein
LTDKQIYVIIDNVVSSKTNCIIYDRKGVSIIPYEIIYYIQRATRNHSETFEIINDFLEWLESHNKDDTIKKFKDALKDLADKNGICPKCGYNLKLKTKPSYLAEAWGVPIYEDYVEYKYCNNCKWTSDED